LALYRVYFAKCSLKHFLSTTCYCACYLCHWHIIIGLIDWIFIALILCILNQVSFHAVEDTQSHLLICKTHHSYLLLCVTPKTHYQLRQNLVAVSHWTDVCLFVCFVCLCLCWIVLKCR
jgi:hypothetical protein